MTIDYNQEFGPNGRYRWPGCLEVAEGLIKVAPCKESSSDCFTEDFFFDHLNQELFNQYPEDTINYIDEEADELIEAAVKERQELFKDAKNWTLPCLVTSAVYYIFSTNAVQIHKISGDLFWLFLFFDKPLFDLFRSKGWDKAYQNDLRLGFMCQIIFTVDRFPGNRLLWGSNEERPWFTREDFTRHIHPEDVLRCLDLIGIDPSRAHLAVDAMFKWQSLIPFRAVLSSDPSSLIGLLQRLQSEGSSSLEE
jgi:hypothetical protein